MGYFDKFKSKGIPFMDGKTKGDLSDIVNQPLHIDDFGFINGANGEYAVVHFAEKRDMFYFGNAILTEMLQEVRKDGKEKELADIIICFDKRTAKETKREYMGFDLFDSMDEFDAR